MRLPYLDPADAEPRVAEMLGRVPDLGIFRLVANAQGPFVHWIRFGNRLLDGEEFDAALRELAILQVARMTLGADYEWVQHVAIARAVGVSDAQIAAIEAGETLDGDAGLVVGFTTEVVRDASPGEETLAAMKARFSTREIVHLLLVIGQYMMLGRIMATARIDLDPAIGGALLQR